MAQPPADTVVAWKYPLEALIIFMADVSQKLSSSWNSSEKEKELLVCSVKAE